MYLSTLTKQWQTEKKTPLSVLDTANLILWYQHRIRFG